MTSRQGQKAPSRDDDKHLLATVPRWLIQTIHRYATSEDIETGGDTFFRGTPGHHEWEAASAVLKWWPRWGESGEASLFADFYFVWDREETPVHLDLFTVGDEPECPWYAIPTPTRIAMAQLAFWQLVSRAFTARLARFQEAIVQDEPGGQAWSAGFTGEFEQTVEGLKMAAQQNVRAEVALRGRVVGTDKMIGKASKIVGNLLC